MKGNVIDLAVGVVIGAAFGKIVSSLVGDVVMPLLAPLLGHINFSDLAFTVATGADGKPVLVKYGAFIQTCFEFLIIALRHLPGHQGDQQAQAPAPERPAAGTLQHGHIAR